MLSVYLRKEPTTDDVSRKMFPKESKSWKDVQAYHDKECTKPFGRFMHYYKSKPDRRNKYVTLNCFRYNAVWLPDLEESK